MLILSLIILWLPGSYTQLLDLNFNPVSPPHVHAHIFTFGKGSVPIAEGANPFANNALDGTEFLALHLGWDEMMMNHRRQDALEFWLQRFGIDGEELMANEQGIVVKYQIHPDVNERAYVLNTPCYTPPEGHEVVDGGFQLLVTDPLGIEAIDPMSGETKHYPAQTNLVYSWLRIHVREQGEDCGVTKPPPEWLLLRYQTLTPAKWTVDALVFELEVVGENYFGRGRSLGVSAPMMNDTHISNRLLNYITFDTAGLEAETSQLINYHVNHPSMESNLSIALTEN